MWKKLRNYMAFMRSERDTKVVLINMNYPRLGKVMRRVPDNTRYYKYAEVSLWRGLKPSKDLWVKLVSDKSSVILAKSDLDVLMMRLKDLSKIPEKEWRSVE